MQVFLLAVLLLSFTVSTSAFLESIFGRLSPSKSQCPIKLYDPKDSSFTGIKLYANVDTFFPLLRKLSQYAKDCHVRIRVKQGFIQENSGLTTLKIQDHTDMAFRLGEAIEFELLDRENKLLCNRLCLEKELTKLKALPDAKCFLEKISKDVDFRQDALKPNLLLRRPKFEESMSKLQDKRKDLQSKCSQLKIDA